jgi:hypothetical protein
MHLRTYEYLSPSSAQLEVLAIVRAAAKAYSDVLERELPESPDKIYALRLHRTCAMWANTAITRMPDGTLRP